MGTAVQQNLEGTGLEKATLDLFNKIYIIELNQKVVYVKWYKMFNTNSNKYKLLMLDYSSNHPQSLAMLPGSVHHPLMYVDSTHSFQHYL